MKLKHLVLSSLLFVPLSCASIKEAAPSILPLRSLEHHDVFIGDVIEVEKRTLEYDGDSKVVDGQIITPSGNTFTGHSFTIEEPGLYRVVYKAYFGFHEEIQEIEYLCKRRSEDFFDITNPVDISYGEYRHNNANTHEEGVLIDFKNGTEIKFNQLLSIEDFETEQVIAEGKGYRDRSPGATAKSLIDFLVDPSTYSEIDFDVLTIRLTDSIDKNNYVDIRIHDAYYAPDPKSRSVSTVRVGASCNWGMGWSWEEKPGKMNQGEFHVGISGTGLDLSFRGEPFSDSGTRSAQILYCSKNSRFYNYRGSLEIDQTYFINDLSDPIEYGNNVWGGFESGKFSLSIIPSSFTNATGRILIKSIGKYILNSEILTDNVAPTINVDTLGYDIYDLPRPVIGKKYPVFNSVVSDNYDTNLEATVSVSYRDVDNKKDIDIAVIDGKFDVTRSGAYTIKYQAQDHSGNQADVVSLRAITVDHVDDVELHLAKPETSIETYSDVVLPSVNDVVATGGTGNVLITRHLVDPQGHTILLTGDTFKPTLVGDYSLVFEGVDYIGNESDLTYTIHSLPLTRPVFIDEVNIEPVFIKDFKYKLNTIRAVETVDNQNVIFDADIKVNGQDYTGPITASGTSMNIEFAATGHSSEPTIISKNIEVLDVKDETGRAVQSRYFYGDFIATENKDDVTLESDTDGEVVFANKLNSDDFYIGMRLVEDYDNAEYINLKFTDVTDKNVTVTFSLDLNEKLIYAPFLPTISYTLYGEDMFGLYYDDLGATFKDINQNELGSIIKDDQGHPFYGFSKGFYLSIGFVGVAGTAKYAVEKIANQVMGYKKYAIERIKPTIKYSFELPSEQFKGQMFVYPTFEAFDVLSDIIDTSIEIKLEGRTLIKGEQYCTETFEITESGYYSVIYIAKDSCNNQLKVTNSVSVYDDAAPTLQVNKMSKTSYSVGDGVKIPKYTANDDSGVYFVDVFVILPTNEMRILLHHAHDENEDPKDTIEYMLDNDKGIYNSSFIVNKTTFRAEIAGTYRLRFVAYDKAFNSTVVEYTFTAR